MKQEKECLSFIEKNLQNSLKDNAINIIKFIDDKSEDKNWNAPNIGKFPEDSNHWSMWWQMKNFFISFEIYENEPKIFCYMKNKTNGACWAEECEISSLPAEMLSKIIKLNNSQETEEDEQKDAA